MNKVYWNYSMRRNDTYCIKCSYKHLGQANSSFAY